MFLTIDTKLIRACRHTVLCMRVMNPVSYLAEMMDVNVNSSGDVRAAGMQVLAAALGPVGFTRFLQQFENGGELYTGKV